MRCLDKQSQKIHKQLKVTSQNQLLSGRNWPPSLKKSLSTEKKKKKKKKQWPRKTKKLLVVNISQTTTDVLKNRSIFFSQWSVQIRHKSYRFLLPRDGCSSLKACQELLQLFDACCAETRSEVLLIREQFCCAPGVAFATFASLALDWSEAGRQLFLLASYLS